MPKREYTEGQRASKRRYYLEHKKDYFRRNKLKRERMRQWLKEQKDRPCMDCGKKYHPYVMDFDHRDRADQEYQPHQLIKRMSWSRMKAEIAKCDVVCSNCHRIRTLAQFPSIYEDKKRIEEPTVAAK